MTRSAIGKILLAALALPVSMPAAAQQQEQITLHSRTNFRGISFTVTGPRANIALPWQVRSIQVRGNANWDVCNRVQFQGCTRINRNQSNIRMTVRSASPIFAAVPPIEHVGNSLRGMSAEFFPRPSDGRGRVVSCASGGNACAQQAASAFCRSRGWNGMLYFRQETVGRQNFLADVLCGHTGR